MNTDNRMNKYLAASIVLAAVLVAGTLWITKQSPKTEIAATPEIIPEASTEATLPALPSNVPVQFPPYKTTTLPYPETHTISLEHLGVSFKIPTGYIAYQREGYEGGYGTEIFIGKEFTPGHIKSAGVRINTFLSEYDTASDTNYFPATYIDILFARENRFDFQNGRYISFLGNKAVQYSSEVSGDPIIVGYVTLLDGEYGIKISGDTYGSGIPFDQRLFDQVVSSFTFN